MGRARTALSIVGVDFTSAPRKSKPIVVAHGRARGLRFHLEALEPLADFDAFERLLRRPGPWVAGFDFPFGLPRELLADLLWPSDWTRLVVFCAALSRRELRGILDGYRATRPAGGKYAHRATDRPAGSSSPMKLVNPPVALMFHEGAPRLAAAGLHVPGLAKGDRRRVALEAYPGLLARAITRASYKNDARAKQTPARRSARRTIVAALEAGAPRLGLRLRFARPALRRRLVDDASGDSLDAVLCALQAAWAAGQPNYGLPRRVPHGEGWIVSAPLA
ncbi:MAG TPA: DUF429 domain-containing protein [Burkholderiales bacterium]|nr:DUF429 domain-containing protein [Burkholderiales bacterium]